MVYERNGVELRIVDGRMTLVDGDYVARLVQMDSSTDNGVAMLMKFAKPQKGEENYESGK